MFVSIKEFGLERVNKLPILNLFLLMHVNILQNQLQVAPTSTTLKMSLQHSYIVGISISGSPT
jgi:hypothetical protein